MGKQKKVSVTDKKRKANGKTKAKANRNSHAKPIPEALSDQQRQTLLFSYVRKITPALEAEKQAKADVNHLYEMAKKEGIAKKDIKLAIQLKTDEGIEAAKSDIERTNRIARWLGVGKQLSLFGDNETVAQRHYEDGRRSALNDQPARPPSHLHTKDANTWLEGHAAGRTSLNETRIQGMKPLGEAVDDLMEKAGVAAAIAGADTPAPEGVAAH